MTAFPPFRFLLTGLVAMAVLGLAAAQPTPTESGLLEVEAGVEIYYERYGTGAPTVFVPNRHELAVSFAPIFEAFDVVTWDPRGRGLSSRPEGSSYYGIDEEIADAEALREHFGVDRITYVAISLWGGVALNYAADHPEAIERLILLSPLAVREGRMGPPEDPPTHDLSDLEAEMAAIEADGIDEDEQLAYCRTSQQLFFAPSYVDLDDMQALLDADTCQYANEQPDKIGEVVFGWMFSDFRNWNWSSQARATEAPTLLIFGSRENFALDGVRIYAEMIPDVGWVELPNAGHHVWNDEADTVMRMMSTFIEGDWPEGVTRGAAD